MLFNFTRSDRKKSGKREIALVMFAIWIGLTIKLFFFSEVDFVDSYSAIYNNLTTILIPSVLAAFAWHSHQVRQEASAEEDADIAEYLNTEMKTYNS